MRKKGSTGKFVSYWGSGVKGNGLMPNFQSTEKVTNYFHGFYFILNLKTNFRQTCINVSSHSHKINEVGFGMFQIVQNLTEPQMLQRLFLQLGGLEHEYMLHIFNAFCKSEFTQLLLISEVEKF